MISPENILEVFKFFKQLQLTREDQDIVIDRIKFTLDNIPDPLKYSVIYYFTQNNTESNGPKKVHNTLENFYSSMLKVKQKITIIQNRSILSRYFYARRDLITLNGCFNLIQDAVKLIQLEKDIINLCLQKQEASKKTALIKSIKSKVQSEKAQSFWTTYIDLEKLQEPVYDLVLKFYQVEFEQIKNKEKIKKQYAISKLLTLMDKDGNGYVDIDEFSEFYQNIWENPLKQQQIIADIFDEQKKPLLNHSQLMVSILEECCLQNLITKFLSLQIDSKTFLTMNYNSLSKIVGFQQAIKIQQAIQQHNVQLNKFEDIRSFCLSIRNQASNIYNQYLQKPKNWKAGFSGICKVPFLEVINNGHIIIQCVNGICTGPFIAEIEYDDSQTVYGYINYFNPNFQKAPDQYYQASYFKPNSIYTSGQGKPNTNTEIFQYTDRLDQYTYQIKNIFLKKFSQRKIIIDQEIFTQSQQSIKQGPTIKLDEKGHQTRQYYYRGEEVSHIEYLSLSTQQNTMEFSISET